MLLLRRAALVALCGLLVAGCPAQQAEPRAAQSHAPAAPSGGGARWVYRPKGPQPLSGRVAVPEGELLVDRGGSRWLSPTAGVPTPAAYGAPEALVAARPTKGGFAFVGDSGSVYMAREPLGAFSSVRRPPEASFGAAAFEDVVLAVGEDGRLRRSPDLGRSWLVVPIDGFVTSVAMDNQGRALAGAAPEQWFWSTDRGASFHVISPGTIAPSALEGGGPQIRAQGWLGPFVFDGSTFRPTTEPEKAPTSWSLRRGTTAGDVRSGQASLERDVVALGHVQGSLTLFVGELGAAANTQRLEGLEGCARYRLTRAKSRLAVLCSHRAEAGSAIELTVYWGDVSTARFRKQPVPLRGDFDLARLALSKEGSLVLSGVCPEKDRDPGCTPRGVHRLTETARELEPLPMAFEELPLALAFTSTGRLAAAALREKDGHALLYLGARRPAELGRLVDLSAELELDGPASGVELLLGEGPLLGVVVHRGDAATAASVTELGEVAASGAVPDDAAAVHGAGPRLAAISPSRGILYESNDGGVTWAPSTLPRAPCPLERTDCTPLLACSDAGCLVGEELTRVGWGTQPESSVASGSATPGARPEAAATEYSCRLDAAHPLRLPHLMEVPGAGEAALGGTDFSVVLFDAERATVEFAWVKRGERRLERAPGFGPVTEPEHYALSVVPQVEGAAALRYRTPARHTGDRMLSEIEVAWNNRIAGVAGHQRFPTLLEGRQGDYHTSTTGPGEAFPMLLSVAGSGVYLALHRGAGDQPIYYFEGSGFETLPPARFPAALGGASDAEYVRIGGEHVPLAFAEDRTRVFLGAHGGGEPSVALLLGEAPATVGRAQGMRLSYRGQRIGVVSMMADLDERFWAARFAELGGAGGQPLGDIVRVPLKPALGAVPKACSSAALAETPRIVAPSFPGPVPTLRVVRGAEELGRFVLLSAVLHGTPDDACLAAWSGSPDTGTVRSAAGVLLLPAEDGLRGWFFSSEDQDSSAGFDAWPLACTLAG